MLGRGVPADRERIGHVIVIRLEQSISNRMTSIAASSRQRIRVDLLTQHRGHFELRFAAEWTLLVFASATTAESPETKGVNK
jgi:hypothetical protein